MNANASFRSPGVPYIGFNKIKSSTVLEAPKKPPLDALSNLGTESETDNSTTGEVAGSQIKIENSFRTYALIVVKISQLCVTACCIVTTMVALAYDDVAGRVRFQLILCSACSAPVLVYYNQLLLLRTEHAKPVKPLKLQVSRYASWMVVSGVLSVLLVLFRGPFGNDSRTVVGLDYEAWIVAAPVMSTVSTLASSLFSFSIKKGILTDRRAHRTLFFFCSVVCLVVCMTAGSLFNYCVYEYTDFSDLEDGGRTHTDRWVAIVMSFTWTVYNFFSITHMISNVARHVGKVAPEKTEWINFKSIEYYSPRLILIEEAALSMVDCLSIALPSVASTVPVLRSGRAN